MTKALFTVIIPTYNRVAYIDKAITNVQNQSFPSGIC